MTLLGRRLHPLNTTNAAVVTAETLLTGLAFVKHHRPFVLVLQVMPGNLPCIPDN